MSTVILTKLTLLEISGELKTVDLQDFLISTKKIHGSKINFLNGLIG